MLAVDARAEGMAVRRARFRPSAARALWANSVLGTAPWSPIPGDRLIEGLRAAIVSAITAAPSGQGVLPVVPPTFRSNADNCSSIAR